MQLQRREVEWWLAWALALIYVPLNIPETWGVFTDGSSEQAAGRGTSPEGVMVEADATQLTAKLIHSPALS